MFDRVDPWSGLLLCLVNKRHYSACLGLLAPVPRTHLVRVCPCVHLPTRASVCLSLPSLSLMFIDKGVSLAVVLKVLNVFT